MIRSDGDSQNSQDAEKDEVLNFFSPVKVMVVNDKTGSLDSVARLLNSFPFEVSCVDDTGLALRLISKKENEFDLLLVDSDMTNMDIHRFLRSIKNMDFLTMVMSEKDDDTFILEALKNGAFHVLKKPLTINQIKLIRQYVITHRIRTQDKCQNNHMIREDYVNNDDDDDDGMKKKHSLEWTQELHEKFLNAITQLGEGRCYPYEIVRIMDVPGLTRKHVASHLQKCRDDNWKSNEKRKTPNSEWNPASTNLSTEGVTKRKGRMPSLQMDKNGKQDNSKLLDLNLSPRVWQTEVKHMINNQISEGSSMANKFSSNRRQESPEFIDFLNVLDGNGRTKNMDLNYPPSNKNSDF